MPTVPSGSARTATQYFGPIGSHTYLLHSLQRRVLDLVLHAEISAPPCMVYSGAVLLPPVCLLCVSPTGAKKEIGRQITLLRGHG